MQRKATKKSTRAALSDEKQFMKWVKDQDCIECGNSPVIVDHMYGATFIHNKVLIGHWALLPLCDHCDPVKTNGSHKAYKEHFGRTQAKAWMGLVAKYDCYAEIVPLDVFRAVMDWDR